MCQCSLPLTLIIRIQIKIEYYIFSNTTYFDVSQQKTITLNVAILICTASQSHPLMVISTVVLNYLS